MSVFYNGSHYKMMISQHAVSQKYECLDYDTCESKLFRRTEERRGYSYYVKKELLRWVIVFLIGLLTAIAGTLVEISIELMTELKYSLVIKDTMSRCTTAACHGLPIVIWISSNMLFVAFGTALVVFIEPIAAGSGVAIVKAYLNGINVRHFIRMKTLCVKLASVACAITGGLGVGKEGPMVHAGTIIGGGISQGRGLPFHKSIWMSFFRGDSEKRDFAAIGAGTGVATAFGSPIGGVLFALEETSSFWKQSHVLRILFSTLTGTFFLNLFLSLYRKEFGLFSSEDLLAFGRFSPMTWVLAEVPLFVLIAIIGGVIGALYNCLSYHLAVYRLKFLPSRKWRYVAEAILVGGISATMGAVLIYATDDCSVAGEEKKAWHGVQLYCADGEYNTQSSFWLQTFQADARAMFLSNPDEFSAKSISLFLVAFFILAVLSNGLKISLGLFVPSLLIGACWGRLLGLAVLKIFPSSVWAVNPGKYAILGATSQMAGIMRLTLSLTVITMESTGDISFGLPLIIVTIGAACVGNILFRRSVYDVILEMKKIPVLELEPPPLSSELLAEDFMSNPVICFNIIHRVGDVLDVFKETHHNGFPIKSKKGTFCGLMLRSQIIVIIKYTLFLESGGDLDRIDPDWFQMHYSRREREAILNTVDEERTKFIDFEPFMSQSVFSVPPTASLAKCFRLFRGLGLRHLVVVDDLHKIIGIITRIDLAKFHTRRNIWKCRIAVEELPIEN